MNATPQRWQAPDFRAPALDAAPAVPAPTLAGLDAIEREAREDGFARGHADGFAQGAAEGRRLAAQIAGVLDAFSRPLADLDGDVQQALGELAVRIAGALVERTYRVEPQLLADFVTRSVAVVAAETRAVEVRLHPDDIAAIEPLLDTADLPAVRLKPDATLGRGDVRVHTDVLRLDGTLGSRLQNVLAQLHLQTEASA